MRFYRPHSFYGLLLTGFFFVSLPLVAALVSSVRILDGLVKQSAVAVYSSVDRVSSSRKIAGLLQDQERKARLYNVLGEASQLAEVNRMHGEITRVLDHLAASVTDRDLLQLIEELRSGESYLVAALNRTSSGPELLKKEQEQILSRYRDIDRLAAAVERASNKLMIDQVDALKEKVSRDKETLIWQTSGLIGFSALLIAVFMVLISKPVRQIDKGIERLGDGDFNTPVEVFGPRDLEALGRKLDWLRQRLAKLDREKVKMVAHISHELKTPLASIKEGVGLLRDELVGPMNRRQEDVVAILDKNCGKLQKLIENILD
ncbi:MAG TPA: HAMP domain-containing histidine kinase, partial [Desulfobulbus sp.]|nr:HAMP domain-containing histidine kinase [Desulfobulbus sp.]